MHRLLTLIFLLTAAAAHAKGPPRGDVIEELLAAPYAEEPVAAVQSDVIAWSEIAGPERNLWIAKAPDFKARRVVRHSQDDGQRLSGLTLSPDGEFLYFVQGGEANASGIRPNPRSFLTTADEAVWRVAVDNGIPRKIAIGSNPTVHPQTGNLLFNQDGTLMTVAAEDMAEGKFEPTPTFHVRGGVRWLSWSPDGERALFASARGDHNFIGVFDPKRRSIKWIAPDTKRDMYPIWSPDSRKIAFLRVPGKLKDELDDFSRGWDFSVWVHDLEQNVTRKLWEAPAAGGDLYQWWRSQPILWADENTIVFNSEHSGWLHSYSLEINGGKLKQLTQGACEVLGNTKTATDNVFIVGTNCGDLDRRHLTFIDVKSGTKRKITGGKEIQMSPVRLSSGNYVAYTQSSVTSPQSIFILDLRSGERRRVSRRPEPSFPATELVAPQSVTFRTAAADGETIYGQIIKSDDPQFAGKKRPALIFLHGGPIRQMVAGWYSVDYYHYFYAINQYLAMQGYVILAVNYRAGIGYGKEYRAADGLGPHGALEYQDILGGARYLKSFEIVDKDNIGIFGGSYGGYLTALALARDSDIFRAGVDLHGVHDWAWRAETFDFTKGGGWGVWGEDKMKIAYEASPVADIETWRSPTLFIHGDDDINVDFSHTVDVVERLRARNVPVETLILPDETHMLLLHENRMRIGRAISSFFDRTLEWRH